MVTNTRMAATREDKVNGVLSFRIGVSEVGIGLLKLARSDASFDRFGDPEFGEG